MTPTLNPPSTPSTHSTPRWVHLKQVPLACTSSFCFAEIKRHMTESCEKPPAPFNWHLARLLTKVARETVAKGAWAVARPESPQKELKKLHILSWRKIGGAYLSQSFHRKQLQQSWSAIVWIFRNETMTQQKKR